MMAQEKISLITLETILGALLIAGGAACLFFERAWPVIGLKFWQGVTYSGVTLLGIGLIRDIGLIVKARRAGVSAKKTREEGADKPICVESVVGAIIVACGLVCLGFGVQRPMRPTVPALVLYLGLIFVISGLIKDLVLVFKVEKDHGNVILW